MCVGSDQTLDLCGKAWDSTSSWVLLLMSESPLQRACSGLDTLSPLCCKHKKTHNAVLVTPSHCLFSTCFASPLRHLSRIFHMVAAPSPIDCQNSTPWNTLVSSITEPMLVRAVMLNHKSSKSCPSNEPLGRILLLTNIVEETRDFKAKDLEGAAFRF